MFDNKSIIDSLTLEEKEFWSLFYVFIVKVNILTQNILQSPSRQVSFDFTASVFCRNVHENSFLYLSLTNELEEYRKKMKVNVDKIRRMDDITSPQ